MPTVWRCAEGHRHVHPHDTFVPQFWPFRACSACLVATWDARPWEVLTSPNAVSVSWHSSLLNMHLTLIDRINLFRCESYQNRSTPQKLDPCTSPDHPTVPSNRIIRCALQRFVGQGGNLHSIFDSSSFADLTSSTSSMQVTTHLTHPLSCLYGPQNNHQLTR